MKTNENDIADMIAAYYDGDLSVEEESRLTLFLSDPSLPERFALDRDVILSMNAEAIVVPDDLGSTISTAIENAAIRERSATRNRRKIVVWLSTAAVAILIAAGISFFSPKNRQIIPSQQPVTARQPSPEPAVDNYETLVAVAESAKPAATKPQRAKRKRTSANEKNFVHDSDIKDIDIDDFQNMPSAEEIIAYETAEKTLANVSAMMCRTIAYINYDREE